MSAPIDHASTVRTLCADARLQVVALAQSGVQLVATVAPLKVVPATAILNLYRAMGEGSKPYSLGYNVHGDDGVQSFTFTPKDKERTMPTSDWWKYDGREDEQDAELEALEKTALDAVRGIADYADAHPDAGLVVGASLRKIGTVASGRAQSISLRPVTMKLKQRS